MYDSYKEKWDSIMSNLPDLPDMDWLKNFFSKENLPQLPDFPDFSMNKGKLGIICTLNLFIFTLILCTNQFIITI
jgi:hypothetical protein